MHYKPKTKQNKEEKVKDQKRAPFKDIYNQVCQKYQKNIIKNEKNEHQTYCKHKKSYLQQVEQIQNNFIETKRQTVRNRGFDISVDHITSINGQINTLLNLTKKDKTKVKQKRSLMKHNQRSKYEQIKILDKKISNIGHIEDKQKQFKKENCIYRKKETQIEMTNVQKLSEINQIHSKSTDKSNNREYLRKMQFNNQKGKNHKTKIVDQSCEKIKQQGIQLAKQKKRKQSNELQTILSTTPFLFLPKPNHSNFTKINVFNQSEKQFNPRTRLIQNQIYRIKSIMQQSYNYNNKQFSKKQIIDKQQNNQPQKGLKKYIRQLANNLSKQVELQRKLFSFKPLFQGKNIHIQSKDIYQKLKPHKVNISLSQIQDIIKSFFQEGTKSKRQYKTGQNYTEFINTLIECKKNWDNYLKHSSIMSKLKRQNFKTVDLDLNQKGYLSIEDLACFINLFAGTYYRNRDISMLFKRLQIQSHQQGSLGLSYQSFQRLLTV